MLRAFDSLKIFKLQGLRRIEDVPLLPQVLKALKNTSMVAH